MPAAKRERTRHGSGPYDRPRHSQGERDNPASTDSPLSASSQARGSGILGTPVRLISGALSWLSPWKTQSVEEEAAEDAFVDMDGEEDGDPPRHVGANAAHPSDRPSSNHKFDETPAARDPSLQAFAKTVGSKFPVPPAFSDPADRFGVNHSQGSTALSADATNSPPSTANDGVRPAVLADMDEFREMAKGGQENVDWNAGAEGWGGGGSKEVLRPRAMHKHSMDPLQVAQYISRMGMSNRARKRALARKHALSVTKSYAVLPERSTPAGSGDPSAFSVAVAKPVAHSVPNVDHSMASNSSVYRGGGRSLVQTPGRDASGLDMSSASGWLNNSAISLGTSTVQNTLHNSTMHASPMHPDASMLSTASAPLPSRHNVSARDFAVQALAPLTAALSPNIAADKLVATPLVGPASASRSQHRALSWQDAPASAQIPQPDRAPSLFPPEEVGAKRARDSFAPEPSPYSANRRASGHTAGGTSGGSGRPAQRRKVSRHPSHTVRRILEIIKDTSTPTSEAKNAPTPRFFSSSAVYAAKQNDSPPQKSSLISAFPPAAPAPAEVGSTPSQKPKPAAAAPDTSGGKSFTFSAPEQSSFTVEPSNLPTLSGAQLQGKFTFKEPGDEESTADTAMAAEDSAPALSETSETKQPAASPFQFGASSAGSSSTPSFAFGGTGSTFSFSASAAPKPFGSTGAADAASAAAKPPTFSFGAAAKPFSAQAGGDKSGAAASSASPFSAPSTAAAAPKGSASASAGEGESGKLSGDAAKKAEEREKAKAELAKKAGVPMTFQWPSKKTDVGFESTGSKEIDAEDSQEGRKVEAPKPAPATAAVQTPAQPVGDSAASTGSSKLTGEAAKKAEEREKAKAELAKKAGVPMTFQWPSKKTDVGFESTGSKEIDEDDAKEQGGALPASTAAQSATGALPSLADMFKPKPGEWDCPSCKTRNKADATEKCVSCEEKKPGAAPATGGSSAVGSAPAFTFGTSAPSTGSGFTFGATPASSAAASSSNGTSFSFGAKKTESAEAKPSEAKQPSLADMFKLKPGEWDCPSCKTRNKADATEKCVSCEEKKPGAAPAAASSSSGSALGTGSGFTFGVPSSSSSSAVGSASTGAALTFGTAAPTFGSSAPASSSGSGFSFGSTSASPFPAAASAPATGGFTFGATAPPAAPAAEAKPAAPSSSTGSGFTFGASSSAAPTFGAPAATSSASSSSSTFTFGAASSGAAATPAPAPSVGFSFGAPSSSAPAFSAASAAAPAPATPSPFQFGAAAPAATPTPTPAPAPATPSFGGGASGGFVFGATPAASSAAAATPSSAPAFGGPAFAFGGAGSGAAPMSSPGDGMMAEEPAQPPPGTGAAPFAFSAPGASTGSAFGAGGGAGGFGFSAPPAASGAGSVFGQAAPAVGAPFAFGAGGASSAPAGSAGFSFGAGSSASGGASAPAFGGFGGGSSAFAFGGGSSAAAPSPFASTAPAFGGGAPFGSSGSAFGSTGSAFGGGGSAGFAFGGAAPGGASNGAGFAFGAPGGGASADAGAGAGAGSPFVFGGAPAAPAAPGGGMFGSTEAPPAFGGGGLGGGGGGGGGGDGGVPQRKIVKARRSGAKKK